jgi:protein involved in polysaccharide export with SLBB domain
VPGLYQVAPGETLNQIIERAGGFTAQAYAYGLEFRRDSVKVSQQRNLETVVRRLETQVRADAQTRLQNVTSAEQAQATQAALRADEVRLNNLRTLQATGRVALGLDPERVQLPSLALEDGDVVNVPTRPAFIGVYGAVNNENAIIWRAGITVDEAIRKAGPTVAADTGQAYVLRADGTVLSSTEKFAFFGLGGLGGTALYPGDTVVVPEKPDRETLYTTFIRGAKDLTAIFYQFGLGAAALKTLQN